MKSLVDLRREADQQKAAFFKDMGQVKMKLKAEYLLDEALHSVDPNSEILTRLESRAKSNPFPALAALGGLYILARQMISRPSNTVQPSIKRTGRSRFVRSTPKGDHHDRFDNAEHN